VSGGGPPHLATDRSPRAALRELQASEVAAAGWAPVSALTGRPRHWQFNLRTQHCQLNLLHVPYYRRTGGEARSGLLLTAGVAGDGHVHALDWSGITGGETVRPLPRHPPSSWGNHYDACC
jgi:hypothetical protein